MVRALDTYADDYVTKPVRPRLLLSRIHAVLRRKREAPSGPAVISRDGLVIDPAAMTATMDGEALDLTKTEFDLLRLLAGHSNRVYTRDEIIERIRGADCFITDRNIDFQICGLRRKLAERGGCIETVRGVGYKFHS